MGTTTAIRAFLLCCMAHGIIILDMSYANDYNDICDKCLYEKVLRKTRRRKFSAKIKDQTILAKKSGWNF